MRYFLLTFLLFITFNYQAQSNVEDNFEGNGTITTWFGDDCDINTAFSNPFQSGINTSSTVLKYSDTGGQYANIRFDVPVNFDLSTNSTFSLKIYIPSSGITGSQPNQISLKLQDGTLGSPWITQSEIVKSVTLNQWQTVTFNFANDSYINLDANSPPPINRTDFNRILLQVNGEANTDKVIAYIDDFLYNGTINVTPEPVFDNLVWSDEFNGNGAIDSNNWFHQTQLPSGGSWYNGEIQHYTNRTDNSSVSGGTLKLTAKKENYTNQGYTKQYTSARLNSKFAFTYGKVVVRAKLPTGKGTWPAIWMLGKNIIESGAYWQTQGFGTTSWPACGEIDIMEHWGRNQDYVQSAIHTPSSSGNTENHGGRVVSGVSSGFHIYSLEWSAEKMVFKVDGVEHYTYNPETKNADTWPFNADQYILLNIAIEPTILPSFTESSMEIDYIRIYQESTASVSNVTSNKISLYPNPVNDKLTIKIPNLYAVTNAAIYSLTGSKVKIFSIKQTTQNLDISSLNKGIYFLKVENNKKVETFKIVKN